MKLSTTDCSLAPERKRPSVRRRLRAFTLIELLVVVGLVAVLSALLFSAAQGMRSRSDRMTCIGNLAQISVASIAFSAEHGGQWPANKINTAPAVNDVFMEDLFPYFPPLPKKPSTNFLKSPFVCPAERSSAPDGSSLYQGVYLVRSYGLSYAQNAYLQDTAVNKRVGLRPAVANPAALMLYMDFQGHYLLDAGRLANASTQARIRERHGRMANAAFADGSVRQVDLDHTPATFPSLFWQGRDN